MRVLILSPHCDDASLSLGGSLLQGYLGSSVQVIVVFSQSRYTKDRPGIAPLDATTAMRMQEERLAAQIAQYDVSFLGFPEPFARAGFDSMADVFDESRNPFADPVWPEVQEAVCEIVRSHAGLLLAPLGCGNHVDHRMVSRVVRDNFGTMKSLPIFYEDLPYAALRDREILARLSPDSSGRHFSEMKLPLPSLDPKLEMLRAYDSQMTEEYYQALTHHWNEHRGEYLWATRAGLAALKKLKAGSNS